MPICGYNDRAYVKQLEVTSINKQKFLAELGKLLTFMYEEDRQRAIEMYSRMFDECEDEMALLQSLVSPTRQAVVVARAYNSNLGRLSLTAESKAAPEDRDENGVPDYVQAIAKVREAAFAAQGISAEKAAEPEAEKVEEPEAESVEEPEAESAEEPEAVKVEEPEAESAEEPQAESAEEPEAESAEEPEAESAEEPEAESVEEPEAESVEEPEAKSAEEPEAVKVEEPEAEKAEESAAAEKPAWPEGIESFSMPVAGKETPLSETGDGALDENSFNINSDALRKAKRKPKVFLLILYILLAIPLTLCAVVILLVPALVFLALAIAAIICGVVLMSTALTNLGAMGLINDCLVLLGVALVLFALGLLFLWTSIWFIGGAIVGVSKMWRVILSIVLIMILIGIIAVAVGFLTGADSARLMQTAENNSMINLLLRYFDWFSQIAKNYWGVARNWIAGFGG